MLQNDVKSANIDNKTSTSKNKNEILGIHLDSKLSFEDQINNLSKKAIKNPPNALARFALYMCFEKKNNYENIFSIPTWILSFSLDGSYQRP